MRCPACGNNCKDGSCNVCGLKKFDQVFMTRNDREKWIAAVVKPLKKKYDAKVMVGGQTFLYLKYNTLWGWGGNISHQIDSVLPREVESPVLIAENVISACATLSYVVYITLDGKLHYRSNGELFERVPEKIKNMLFSNVYGNTLTNSIVLECANKDFLFLGENCDGLISPNKTEDIVKYKYTKSYQYSISGGGYYVDEPLMYSLPKYCEYKKKYGENCLIDEISDDGSEKTVRIRILNKQIWNPERITKEISTQNFLNGLPRLKNCNAQYNEWLITKRLHSNIKYRFRHYENGDLCASIDGKDRLRITNILSFSASDENVILINSNGNVLYGEFKNFCEHGIRDLETIEQKKFKKAENKMRIL